VDRRRARGLAWGWLAVLALAFALRLPSVFAGLPYLGYVDEGHTLHRVVRLLSTRHWDPAWYTYPSLPLYAIAGAAAALSPAYRAVHGSSLERDLSPYPPPYYDLVEPPELIAIARGVVLAVSLGIVVLTGLLARRLAGEAAGLGAALIAAVLPALVIRGAVVTVDPFATLFTVAAVLCAEIAATSSRFWGPTLLAGAMLGCAATSKYPAAMAVVAAAPALARLPTDRHGKLRALELFLAAALVASLVTMPALALRNTAVLTHILNQSAAYSTSVIGSYWDQALRRAEWSQPFPHPELGVVFLMLVGAGWIAALRDRRLRPPVVAWTLCAMVWCLAFLQYPFRTFRNLLPLLPFACVVAAALYARLRERLPPSSSRRRVDLAAAAALLALFLPADLDYARARLALVDSRVQAVDWLVANVRPGDEVLVSAELAILPRELRRLPVEPAVLAAPRARAWLRQHPAVEYVVTGRLKPSRAGDVATFLERNRIGRVFRLAARFGEQPSTRVWRGNNQLVLIYQRRIRS
jgi:4-amino-4-deoxy-L-arabinose transferase-like glycosyltransferase